MADVTDAAFRRIIAKYSEHGTENGGPDVFYTEFVSCDGLCSKGREVLLRNFMYTENERPIVAQIFGDKPKNIHACARLIKNLGFDGIDINMGCPDRSVEKQGAGAALIKDPALAKEIIVAAKEGGGDLPVSVKTRLGYNSDTLEEWLPELLEAKPAAIALHARTRKEMSKPAAHWDRVARAVEIARGSGVLIIGNGDVKNMEDARQKAQESGADGVMLGRAVFGNPWLFANVVPSTEEKLRVMVEHTKLFEEILGDTKNFAVMKKHYKAYVNGFDGAKELRIKLMETKTAKDVVSVVENFLGERA